MEVFKPVKVIVKVKDGEAELPIYIVCDDKRNIVLSQGKYGWMSKLEAEIIAKKCNIILDEGGIVTNAVIQEIADKMQLDPFAGLNNTKFSFFNLWEM